MPVDINYLNVSPLYVWGMFMLYNWFQSRGGLYGFLNTIISLDYRVLLVTINVVGVYLFLRHARIDFTLRIAMNNNNNNH
jgi:hypothetical protein